MRTISNNLKIRLTAQTEEAKFNGFDKIADDLTTQINKHEIRQDSEEYVYSSKDLKKDVKDLLWSAAIRVQDYYGKTADAKELNDIIESYCEELITSTRTKIGGDVIGKYEPLVPGELRLSVEIEDDYE